MASCDAGAAEQLDRRAAHEGTVTGLGWAVGDGDGLGDGLSIGLGLGLGLGLGVGECEAFGARGPFGVQPASASSKRRTTTPFLTGA